MTFKMSISKSLYIQSKAFIFNQKLLKISKSQDIQIVNDFYSLLKG